MRIQARFTPLLVLAAVACLMCTAVAAGSTGRARDQDAAKTHVGLTVWDGVYTAEQADRGKALYGQSCASCHAADLRGDGTAPSLIEEEFSFQWSDTSVAELFEQIRKLMPSDRPNSLPRQSYADIVAFILQSNKLPSGEKPLDPDADVLARILITMKRR